MFLSAVSLGFNGRCAITALSSTEVDAVSHGTAILHMPHLLLDCTNAAHVRCMVALTPLPD